MLVETESGLSNYLSDYNNIYILIIIIIIIIIDYINIYYYNIRLRYLESGLLITSLLVLFVLFIKKSR